MASVTARTSSASGALPAGVAAVLVVVAGLFSAVVAAMAPANPLLPLVLGAGLAAVWLAIARPMVMLYIGIAAIPAEGQLDAVIGPSQAALALAVGGFLLRWAISRPITLPRHPALAALAVLVLANAAGWPGAPEPLLASSIVTNWSILLVIAASIAHWSTQEQLMRVLFMVAIFGGLLGGAAIVDPQPLVAGATERATGGFGSPNALGMLLVMAIPIQIVFALRGTRQERTVAAICLLLALVAMSLAVSRAAFIALGAAVLLLALWGPFTRTAALVLPAVAALALIGSSPADKIFNTEVVVERLSTTRESAENDPRLFVWGKAPAMIADRPLFGQGPAQFGYYSSSYGILASQGRIGHAHNLFITTTVEAGLVGGAALLWVFVAAGIGLRRVIRLTTGRTQALAFALAASLFGFFVNGILDYALAAAEVATIFFVLIGCAAALSLRAGREAANEPTAAAAAGHG